MQFAIVYAHTQKVSIEDCPTIEAAMARAGLVNVDHGVVAPVTPYRSVGMGIIVYEYGLFEPIEKQAYFAIGGRLYAGNAVIYAFDQRGETVNLPGTPVVQFMPSARAVERNIALGLVERPIMSINDEVIWRWPEPRV